MVAVAAGYKCSRSEHQQEEAAKPTPAAPAPDPRGRAAEVTAAAPHKRETQTIYKVCALWSYVFKSRRPARKAVNTSSHIAIVFFFVVATHIQSVVLMHHGIRPTRLATTVLTVDRLGLVSLLGCGFIYSE